MRYLLDTHIILWSALASKQLPSHVHDILANPNATLYTSLSSYWELTIKYCLGKLPLPDAPSVFFANATEAINAQILEIQYQHIAFLEVLPKHHNDPFDRMLICQARMENLKLISADKTMRLYDVPLIKA